MGVVVKNFVLETEALRSAEEAPSGEPDDASMPPPLRPDDLERIIRAFDLRAARLRVD
jgi:hypothetical protein